MQTIPLIFRCDANSEVGWGHFRRCYALAEVAQQSGRFRVHFLCRELPRSLRKKLSEIHAQVQILPEPSTLADDLACLHSMFDLMSRKRVVVCIDQPDYDSECFKSLRTDQRLFLIAFDDGLRRFYDCHFVVNPSLEAETIAYATSPECERLLGPKYAMIREEIHTLRQSPTERISEQFQFVVSLGAGDRWGFSIKAVEAAKKSSIKYETHLVVGSDWPHTESAKRLIGNHPRIHFYEDPSFFPQLMARADLALTAAGNTTYELAYLGIPMLTASLNASQNSLGLAWAQEKIGEHLGAADALTSDRILEKILLAMESEQELEERGMSGQRLVDGRGKFRLLEKLSKVLNLVAK